MNAANRTGNLQNLPNIPHNLRRKRAGIVGERVVPPSKIPSHGRSLRDLVTGASDTTASRRLAIRRGIKRALMAVAHSILITAYSMIKQAKAYEDLGGDYFDRINKSQLQNHLIRRLHQLGLTVTVQPAV